MKRSSSSLSLACCSGTLVLVLGCTGQVGPGVVNPAGTGAGTGTHVGAGTGGTGVGPGPGGTSVVGPGTAGTGVVGPGSGGTGGVGPGAGGTGVVGSAGSGGTVVAGDPNAAGLRPLRLMTRREYSNTVRDLLGDTSVQPAALPSEDEDPASGFAFRTTGTVATLDATLFRDVAEALAKGVVTRISTLLPCATTATAAAAQMTCLTSAFAAPTATTPGGLLMRMYRRPLSPADITRLTALYVTGGAAPLSLPFAGQIGLLVEAVLQSPEFLYHWGDPAAVKTLEGSVTKLGPYELADRLSYFIWGTMPDAALFTAAAAGQLADAAGVDTQVRRMLKDAKTTGPAVGAAGTLGLFGDFVTDWLDMDTLSDKPKDPKVYAGFDAMEPSMEAEVNAFVNAILVTGTGHFDELLTGTASFANQALGTLYGSTPAVTGTALKPVMLPAAQRSGLFTSAGFMSLTGSAAGSNPPRRGKAILEKLLCGTLPPPPAVAPVAAAAPGNGTTRQRFETHVSNPCATACHSIIDPLGFPFENYDGMGAYRTTDNGMPVNAAVTVSVDGQPMMVADARGLMAAMATSDQVQTCFTKQWFRYGLGRTETALDQASINASLSAFKSSTRDVRELLVGLATSRTFRYRTPAAMEVL
jgi:Protein of unknown function (DUF1592)/Protein of unknown function (DUF1588)/Protein of unknown function (DUF1585)/Protein of unknown function (DUF1587)/Protein of unknown function (DUF1595)